MWVQSLGQEDSPGVGNGNLLQYSWLENPMDRGAWWDTVHGVAESHRTEHAHTWSPGGVGVGGRREAGPQGNSLGAFEIHHQTLIMWP